MIVRKLLPLLFLCAYCQRGQAAPQSSVIDTWRGDLNHDGKPVTVEITCNSRQNGHPLGGEIVVIDKGVIWRQPNLNPWKLVTADVDGDGKREIIVGVWKKSPKDQVMAKRVFVYSWNGKRMLPKWLGSKLSRRFDDFTFCDINKDGWDELLALETAPGDKHRVAAYRWNVFGFDWLGCTAEMPGLASIETSKGRVTVGTKERKLSVKYSHAQLSINQ